MNLDRATLRNGCLEAVTEGLTFANRLLLGGEDGINADEWDPSDFQHRKTVRLLELLEQDRGFTVEDLQRHPGHEPIRADRETHVVLQGTLKRLFPDCYVVGEEATGDEWMAAIDSPPGSLIFSVDAVDGSSLYESYTYGYACNVLAYTRGRDMNKLMLAIVANSSGFVACYERDEAGAQVGNVFAPSQGKRLKPITDPIIREDFKPEVIAANAATPDRRLLIAPLLIDEKLVLSTLGGAPAALGLVFGKLGALVCPKPQTTYDTAYLPVLASLGITILTMRDNFVLSLKNVLEFFDHIAGVGGAWTPTGVTKPVPAFIAARNPQFAAELRERLA